MLNNETEINRIKNDILLYEKEENAGSASYEQRCAGLQAYLLLSIFEETESLFMMLARVRIECMLTYWNDNRDYKNVISLYKVLKKLDSNFLSVPSIANAISTARFEIQKSQNVQKKVENPYKLLYQPSAKKSDTKKGHYHPDLRK